MTKTVIATGIAAALATAGVHAQQVTGTVESHLATAKTAAGTPFTALYNRICMEYEKPLTPPPPPGQGRVGGGGGRQAGPPPASQWHA